MDKGLEQPCPDSDVVFNDVHGWMSEKALRRRSRVIPGERLEVVDQIVRDRCCPPKAVWNSVQALEDQDWVVKEAEGFRVLVFQERIDPVLHANGGGAPLQRDTLAGVKPTGCRAVRSETSAASRATPSNPPGGMEESVPSYGPEPKYPSSTRVQLARQFFPDLCRQHGIMILPGQFDWRPLARALRTWEQDYGIDQDMARQMIEEFVTHPEWCQNKSFPGRAFIARRDKLVDLVTTRQRRDPANRRHTQGADYWLAR